MTTKNEAAEALRERHRGIDPDLSGYDLADLLDVALATERLNTVERAMEIVDRVLLYDADYRIHTMGGEIREQRTMADAALSQRDRSVAALRTLLDEVSS